MQERNLGGIGVMEILAILETLEEVIEKGTSIPFSGKCVVDREEVLELVKEIRLKLPDDIKQAKWVKDERQRILMEAQKEANLIIEDAEGRIHSMVDDHEIIKKAYEHSDEIVNNAQKSAKEIRQGTKEYADDILERIEELLGETVEVIQLNRKELKS
jgi:vacuolar-type H+-ATPase subunit H